MGVGPSKPTAAELECLVSRFDANCRGAAEALCQADVLLLCTGAGFSADSGLAVYKDIAELQAYQDLGLRYHDICRPEWLRHDPELFYGFWGTCYNDYRDTEPHAGYRTIRVWRDERFADSEPALAIQAKLKEYGQTKNGTGGSRGSTSLPYPIDGHAGAFFVYTSNVDAHSFDHFEHYEVRECHGNTEVWQCGRDPQPCCQRTWRAPLDFRFAVDMHTMRAPRTNCDSPPCTKTDVGVKQEVPEDGSAGLADAESGPKTKAKCESGDRAARAGHVHKPFGCRQAPLVRLPKVGPDVEAGFPAGVNWPRCPHCEGLARPAILMFNDLGWINDTAQDRRWVAWCQAVADVARAYHQNGPRLRVLILEIGCGCNVPTVRHATEGAAAQFLEKADVTVVRVNPDYPLPDRLLTPTEHLQHLALPCQGLEAMWRIQRHYESIQAAELRRASLRDAHRRERGQSGTESSEESSALAVPRRQTHRTPNKAAAASRSRTRSPDRNGGAGAGHSGHGGRGGRGHHAGRGTAVPAASSHRTRRHH